MGSSTTDQELSHISEAPESRTIDSDTMVAIGKVGWVAKGVVYVLMGAIATPIALQGGSSGGSSRGAQASRQGAIAKIAENSFGGVLLVAFVYKGIGNNFMEQIDLSGAGSTERSLIDRLGTIVWIGRGITVMLLSFFVLEAAINANPDEARGLDQALRETADTW